MEALLGSINGGSALELRGLVKEHFYGKSPLSIGNSTIHGPFSIAKLVDQRVYSERMGSQLELQNLSLATTGMLVIMCFFSILDSDSNGFA